MIGIRSTKMHLLGVTATLLLLLSTSVSMVKAFSAAKPTTAECKSRYASALKAWSLPDPTQLANQPFIRHGSSWYNEVDPTFRKTSYNDAPTKYTFTSFGEDWPSSYVTDKEPTTSYAVGAQRRERRRRLGVVRRVVRRLRARNNNKEEDNAANDEEARESAFE
eukprot:CAMPEP_0194046074 /NCGR_PEP_ID=MMETSP0009_2-20130614/19347_1 /TAXON_ID=210454 /ORGANISM="Grammatophora oceanica, Strain CCMP 410" /LENGTH=163 /DNA_ID=CAMNT_0038691213 /DNA_START=212 /DNA_END=703 /DNA_ORIENTATION=+